MPDAQFELVDAKDGFADSDWFHHCRKHGKPFVVVRSGETNADVLWDYVTLPPCCDDRLRRNLDRIKEDARAIFGRHARPDSAMCVKPTAIFFDRLPIDAAKRAANELYALIDSHLKAAVKAERKRPAEPGESEGSGRIGGDRDGDESHGGRPGSRSREAPPSAGFSIY